MARRNSAAWGNTPHEAQRASNETFYFSNSCLQHENLNQDEWLMLEDWVLNLDLDDDGLITVFSGPFYGENDRTIKPQGRTLALIPAGFWKIVCFKNKTTKKLDVRAFIMYQDEEAMRDKNGKNLYNNQTEIVDFDNKIRCLVNEIAILENKIRKEPQFNRKVELNKLLLEKKNELKVTKKVVK